jgi:YidC/Oxa1 family membrane protein insertase
VTVLGAIWNGAADLLYKILELLFNLTSSYGFSIVILTVVIRLALYPLNQKQMVSMQQMQKIQPKLKMLQEKYGDDKQKLTEETMRLYKEYKVNPMAGCFPLLIQLPILILLFQVLRKYNFGDTSFFGVMLSSSVTSGLAKAVGAQATESIMTALKAVVANPAGLANVGFYLGNLVLLLSVAVLTWVQQKMTGGDNPQMAMMNTVMPIFMAFICLSMPGGVMLYWGLSSLIGVVQQYFVMKHTKEEMANKPTLHRNKPVKQGEEEEDDEEYEDDDDEYEDEDDEEEDGDDK